MATEWDTWCSESNKHHCVALLDHNKPSTMHVWAYAVGIQQWFISSAEVKLVRGNTTTSAGDNKSSSSIGSLHRSAGMIMDALKTGRA